MQPPPGPDRRRQPWPLLPGSIGRGIFRPGKAATSPRGGGLVAAAQARRGATQPGRKRPAQRPGLHFHSDAHLPPGLALDIAALDRLALVVDLLAAPDADLDLREPVLEVELQRDQREPLLLDLPGELRDLAAMQQDLAPALWLVVVDIAERVGLDL